MKKYESIWHWTIIFVQLAGRWWNYDCFLFGYFISKSPNDFLIFKEFQIFVQKLIPTRSKFFKKFNTKNILSGSGSKEKNTLKFIHTFLSNARTFTKNKSTQTHLLFLLVLQFFVWSFFWNYFKSRESNWTKETKKWNNPITRKISNNFILSLFLNKKKSQSNADVFGIITNA